MGVVRLSIILLMLRIVEGCQVCSPWPLFLRHDTPRGKHALLGLTVTKGIVMKQKTFVTVAALGVVLARAQRSRSVRHRFYAESEKVSSVPKEDDTRKEKGQVEKEESKTNNATSTAMISVLGVYKNFISPFMPPACRFVPTCSQYGVQAIERFGPNKGVVLIAWRLLRCSPLGGKGYDPPQWPPVTFTYSSY